MSALSGEVTISCDGNHCNVFTFSIKMAINNAVPR